MTLLAPLAGLGALAAGTAVLVAMYLLRLRRRPVRVGSTMLWQQAAVDLQVNVPLRMIRRSWLLAVHALAVLMTALAIARPAIETGAPAADHVVVVVDRSASMRALMPGGEGTRLDAAKARALAVIDATRRRSPRPAVSVAAFAADAELLERETRSLPRARDAIARITATDQPGRPSSVNELVAAITSGAGEETGAAPRRATVYVCTDGGGLDASPIEPPGCAVVHEVVPAGSARVASNLGITAAAASRDIDDPAVLRLFARVESTLDREAGSAVEVRRGGDRLLLDTVRTPAAEGGATSEAVWTASLRDEAGGALSIVLARPDALEADNTAHLVVPAWRELAVTVVAPAVDGRASPSPFLMDVLSALTRREIRVVSPEGLAASGASGADVVVYDGVAPASRGTAPQLVLGACPPELTRPGEGEVRALPGGPAPVVSWERRDPLLRDAGLAEVVVGAACALPEPETGAEAAWYRVIARGTRGPLMLARDDAPRRVVVGFPLDGSNWRLSVSFPLFVAAAVDWLAGGSGRGSEAAAATTAEPVTVVFDRAASGPALVRGPFEREAALSASGREASVGVLPLAGPYRVRAGDAEVDVGVNLFDSGETSLTVARPADRAAPGAAGAEDATEDRRELWPWVVLAVVALLTGEWVLYAWLMRG